MVITKDIQEEEDTRDIVQSTNWNARNGSRNSNARNASNTRSSGEEREFGSKFQSMSRNARLLEEERENAEEDSRFANQKFFAKDSQLQILWSKRNVEEDGEKHAGEEDHISFARKDGFVEKLEKRKSADTKDHSMEQRNHQEMTTDQNITDIMDMERRNSITTKKDASSNQSSEEFLSRNARESEELLDAREFQENLNVGKLLNVLTEDSRRNVS